MVSLTSAEGACKAAPLLVPDSFESRYPPAENILSCVIPLNLAIGDTWMC